MQCHSDVPLHNPKIDRFIGHSATIACDGDRCAANWMVKSRPDIRPAVGRTGSLTTSRRRKRPTVTSITAFPQAHLAKDLVEQPDRAAEQRNQAQSQRRGNLPQPCGIPTPGTTVVIEAHDEWQVTCRYLSDISMAELRKVIAAKQAADNPSPNKAKSPSIQPDSLITTRSRPGALDRRRVALKF